MYKKVQKPGAYPKVTGTTEERNYTAGGVGPTPPRRGSELEDGNETSSLPSPVGSRGTQPQAHAWHP
ncbi:hypothetical protein Taro_032050 [Colocasia esculenta]|uniref:Uncharacterized protein n=1 Tax=Colocasia esculenta TaxID=4460 RepID=A0A843W898_COLES|nr:hypothetical protein [Colocasia esculenta]